MKIWIDSGERIDVTIPTTKWSCANVVVRNSKGEILAQLIFEDGVVTSVEYTASKEVETLVTYAVPNG